MIVWFLWAFFREGMMDYLDAFWLFFFGFQLYMEGGWICEIRDRVAFFDAAWFVEMLIC